MRKRRKDQADDKVSAADVIAFIEQTCFIPEGKDVGKRLKLYPWQKQEITRIYDNPSGPTRRAIISMGRKNAKTTLSACLLLAHLCGPPARNKPNSQLYSAAQSRDQAAVIFHLASKMVRLNPHLARAVTIRETAKELYCPELGTRYRALSADATTAYGLSPSLVIHDELGQVRGPRSPLYEALETATGAVVDPLTIIISTQAPTDADLFSMLIDDAKAGHDPHTVLSLYTAPVELDPFDEATIRLANPALGTFLNAKEVLAMAENARRMPSREAEYRNLVLNQRVETSTPFIAPAVWKSCGEKAVADRTPWDLWARQGYLQTTPGRTVSYEYVAQHLRGLFRSYNIRKVGFDRWNMRHLKPWLLRAGFSEVQVDQHFVEFGQGMQSMSPALRDLEQVLLDGQLAHGDHPVLSMCVANTVITLDDAGNRKPSKRKSVGRIDGLVSLAMAIGVAPLQTTKPIDIEALIG